MSDIGATGPGLVLRGDRERDFVSVGDRVSVEVAAVEARDAGPPRLDLGARRGGGRGRTCATTTRGAADGCPEPEPEPEPTSMFDDLDDHDIEASLGLDEHCILIIPVTVLLLFAGPRRVSCGSALEIELAACKTLAKRSAKKELRPKQRDQKLDRHVVHVLSISVHVGLISPALRRHRIEP